MPKKVYMVVEHFTDAAAVYRRLWDRGRTAPEGLVFVSAWFEENLERSYRLMQTHRKILTVPSREASTKLDRQDFDRHRPVHRFPFR